MKLNIVYLGHIKYEESLRLQEKLFDLRLKDLIDDTILLLEHSPVITLGIRGKEKNILIPKETLNENKIKVFKINRGGDVTYHCPGQLVGYLIFDLKNHNKSIKNFVWKIEEAIIRFLRNEYNIESYRDIKKYTGIWVNNDKITALGLNVRKWITTHGFSLNINPYLENFKLINPCGIIDRGITSLEKLMVQKLDFDDATRKLSKYFCEIFNLCPEYYNKKDFLEYIEGV
jgi:lipoyl(octanoyl) transferase